MIAGTADAVMMVEGGGNEITEEDFLGAVEFAHGEIQEDRQGDRPAREKSRQAQARVSRSAKSIRALDKWVRKAFAKDVAKAMRVVDKQKRETAFAAMTVAEALARCGKKDEAVKALLENPTDFGKEFDKIIKAMEEDELAHDGRRRKNPSRRPQARRDPPDLVQGALRSARPRLRRLYPRSDAGLHRRDAGFEQRRAAPRRHRRARRQALHALLQLSAVLGRRDAPDARSRPPRDRPRLILPNARSCRFFRPRTSFRTRCA